MSDTPPHDSNAEKLQVKRAQAEAAVICDLLLDSTNYAVVAERLTTYSFSRLSHRRIFEAVGRLEPNNTPADIVTIRAKLNDAHAPGVGWTATLASIMSPDAAYAIRPTPANARLHTEELLRM